MRSKDYKDESKRFAIWDSIYRFFGAICKLFIFVIVMYVIETNNPESITIRFMILSLIVWGYWIMYPMIRGIAR